MDDRRPSALRCAFVAVRSRPGSPLPADLLQRLPVHPELPFESATRTVWTDDADETLVVAWQEDAPPDRRRWLVDDRGVVLTTGRLRHKGRPWTAPHTWAEQLAPALRDGSVEELLDAHSGQYLVLAIDANGVGVLAGDPMGYAFTFHAAGRDVDVVASTAALASAAATPAGATVARDLLTVAGLAYAPYHIGRSTGFAGVELLPEGTIVRFERGQPLRIGGRPAPWLDRTPLDGRDRTELLDSIVDRVSDEISAAIDLDADDHIVDLTGGKDSRLVLATVLLAGLTPKVRFVTFGPDTLADVRVARTIADRFGLDHRWGLDEHAPPERSYVDDVRSFAEITSGTVNVWHAKRSAAPTRRVRISGNFAEILRAHTVVDRTDATLGQLAEEQVRRFRQRFLPLLDADVASRLDERALEEMGDDPVGGSDPLDLFETFFARNRARWFWGPLLDREPDERIWALVDADTTRAAFALGGHQRQIERVHFDVVRQASDDLVRIPFAGPGWHPDLDPPEPSALAFAADTAPSSPDPPPGGPRGRPPRARAEALVGLMRRTANPTRQAFVGEVLADRSSPVWDIVDRPATLTAFERWNELEGRHRLQVFGVVTALLWMG